MTSSTLEHVSYAQTVEMDAPRLPDTAVPEERAVALEQQKPVTPDPDARARMAAVLYRLTGWETFGGDERAYVSRLWAEDWDSPEDSIYDEL